MKQGKGKSHETPPLEMAKVCCLTAAFQMHEPIAGNQHPFPAKFCAIFKTNLIIQPFTTQP